MSVNTTQLSNQQQYLVNLTKNLTTMQISVLINVGKGLGNLDMNTKVSEQRAIVRKIGASAVDTVDTYRKEHPLVSTKTE